MMKRLWKIIAVFLIVTFCLTGCADQTVTHIESTSDDDTEFSFAATFYDNYGTQWLEVSGTSFDIKPNKVKEYAYDTSGKWTYSYSTSSVMSVSIDGNDIESCGSTIIFADKSLTKYDCELPEDEVTLSTGDSVEISIPNSLRASDYWTLHWWWKTANYANKKTGSKIVIIQSQNGNPICMYMGDNVTWELSTNLPKTTEVNIDGKMVYIHRANFAIIDTSIFE
jgi:hypothetical protein